MRVLKRVVVGLVFVSLFATSAPMGAEAQVGCVKPPCGLTFNDWPARIVFDDAFLAHPVGYTGSHGFTVLNAFDDVVTDTGWAWYAYINGANTLTAASASGQLGSDGRGVFSYTGRSAGVDTITIKLFHSNAVIGADPVAAGVAVRTYGLQSLPNMDGVVSTVRFDDAYYNAPIGYYGEHGFVAENVFGEPVANAPYAVRVAGANSRTFTGSTDAAGRAVISYTGSNSGIDALGVTSGAAVGSAVRSYGLPDDDPCDLAEIVCGDPVPCADCVVMTTADALAECGDGWWTGNTSCKYTKAKVNSQCRLNCNQVIFTIKWRGGTANSPPCAEVGGNSGIERWKIRKVKAVRVTDENVKWEHGPGSDYQNTCADDLTFDSPQLTIYNDHRVRWGWRHYDDDHPENTFDSTAGPWYISVR